MARTTHAEINLSAIKKNYLYAKSLSPTSKAIATVKANAYGHGAVPVARYLNSVVDAFGVASIEEAQELREHGIDKPIVLLEGFFEEDELAYISAQNLWCVVHSQYQIDAIKQQNLTKPIHVWLKMDSGMHRLGFSPAEYRAAYQQLSALNHVASIVHMSHFASADDQQSEQTHAQMTLFANTIEGLPGEVSLANSAATLAHPQARMNWLRPGIMLYGAAPVADNQQRLQPAMTFYARVIAQRCVEPGEGVGYNHLWQAQKLSTIGTVSVGYADGYPRHALNNAFVFIDGVKCAVVGRVSMDMITVDLSHFADQNCIGKKVELWGENILANELATAANTISYDLFCGITRRVTKSYHE